MTVWVIIPVKSLDTTKSRLAAVLSPAGRADLTRRLLARLLAELRVATAVARVLVVTQDERVRQLALSFGALVVAEPEAADLSGAIAFGLAQARQRGAAGALVLPSDLPLVTAQDVWQVLRVWSGHNVVICGDEARTGTNALLLPTAVRFDLAYGPDSFRRHVQAAQNGRLPVRIVANSNIQFDVDTIQDWLMYQAMQPVQPIEP